MLINRVPKGPLIAVTRGKKRDGSEWTIWTKAMPIYDGQGNFIAAVATVRTSGTTRSQRASYGSPGTPPTGGSRGGVPETGGKAV